MIDLLFMRQNICSFGGGSVAPPAWLKTDNPAVQDIAFGAATATFTDAAIGTASSDRVVVVCVSNNVRTLTGLTIGGSAAAEAISSGTGAHTGIWYRALSTGTTATVVASAAANFGKIGITVGILTGVNATPTSTGFLVGGNRANPQTASSCTIPAGGIAVIAAGDFDTAPGAYTYNNGTADYYTAGTAFSLGMGYRTTAGAFQASLDMGAGFNTTALAVAAWGA